MHQLSSYTNDVSKITSPISYLSFALVSVSNLSNSYSFSLVSVEDDLSIVATSTDSYDTSRHVSCLSEGRTIPIYPAFNDSLLLTYSSADSSRYKMPVTLPTE